MGLRPQFDHCVHGQLQVRRVLYRAACEVRVQAPLDGQVRDHQHRAALPLKLNDDGSKASNHIRVGLAAGAGVAEVQLVLLPCLPDVGVLSLDLLVGHAVADAPVELVQKRSAHARKVDSILGHIRNTLQGVQGGRVHGCRAKQHEHLPVRGLARPKHLPLAASQHLRDEAAISVTVRRQLLPHAAQLACKVVFGFCMPRQPDAPLAYMTVAEVGGHLACEVPRDAMHDNLLANVEHFDIAYVLPQLLVLHGLVRVLVLSDTLKKIYPCFLGIHALIVVVAELQAVILLQNLGVVADALHKHRGEPAAFAAPLDDLGSPLPGGVGGVEDRNAHTLLLLQPADGLLHALRGDPLPQRRHLLVVLVEEVRIRASLAHVPPQVPSVERLDRET
mmetsp:Transcript_99429/g.259225  ORF Transcript_99429/g.259225 Transcript_99429/m.259225 type:complete len:390 (-) Transcript_99429:155-1324(-)